MGFGDGYFSAEREKSGNENLSSSIWREMQSQQFIQKPLETISSLVSGHQEAAMAAAVMLPMIFSRSHMTAGIERMLEPQLESATAKMVMSKFGQEMKAGLGQLEGTLGLNLTSESSPFAAMWNKVTKGIEPISEGVAGENLMLKFKSGREVQIAPNGTAYHIYPNQTHVTEYLTGRKIINFPNHQRQILDGVEEIIPGTNKLITHNTDGTVWIKPSGAQFDRSTLHLMDGHGTTIVQTERRLNVSNKYGTELDFLDTGKMRAKYKNGISVTEDWTTGEKEIKGLPNRTTISRHRDGDIWIERETSSESCPTTMQIKRPLYKEGSAIQRKVNAYKAELSGDTTPAASTNNAALLFGVNALEEIII